MEVLTTSEAVRQFQMHPATVLRLILTRRVAAHKDANGRWLVRRTDLERWDRQRVRRAPRKGQIAVAVFE
jgi:hypothetical protein